MLTRLLAWRPEGGGPGHTRAVVDQVVRVGRMTLIRDHECCCVPRGAAAARRGAAGPVLGLFTAGLDTMDILAGAG